MKYAIGHWRPLIATPLLPVVVLLLTALGCATFGLLFRLPWVGPLLGGLFLFVPMVLGFVMFVLVAGLAAGWPLMVASVAAEGEDELDALSRSFSYLNHRLVRYAFFLFVAFLIGIPGNWLVELVIGGSLQMMQWGLALTLPLDSINAAFPREALLFRPGIGNGSTSTWSVLPGLWIALIRVLPRAWAYSYFWTSISLIYLLIRKDVDGAVWSQLKRDGLATEPSSSSNPS